MSSCEAFFQALGVNPADAQLSDIQNDVFNQGVGCVNSNMGFCANACRDLTKNLDACYTCLSQAGTCPDTVCRQTPVDCKQNPDSVCCKTLEKKGSCCPLVKEAVECSFCAGKNNPTGAPTLQAYTACNSSQGLSQTVLIIIIVVSIVTVLLVVVVVVVVVKLRRKRRAKKQLEADLRTKGVSSAVSRQLGQLDISSNVAKNLDLDTMLQKIKTPPPPQPLPGRFGLV